MHFAYQFGTIISCPATVNDPVIVNLALLMRFYKYMEGFVIPEIPQSPVAVAFLPM